MTNAPEYSCNCGARFYTLGAQTDHLRVAPRKCLKTDRKPLSPEEYAANNPSEHGQQVALFMWAALPETLKQYPVLEYMFAIPNGGLRDRITASRLKAEGVKSGVPDIFLPVPKRVYPTLQLCYGLFIEMKRPKSDTQRSGLVMREQGKYLSALIMRGYAGKVCYSFQEARGTIITYLDDHD